jgi:ubiquitin C-terminal hydrolase
MKTPELQRSHTTEERGPSILQVAEEKTTKINIYNNHPMKYNGSPFESRTNDRKKYPNEDAFIPLSKDQSESNSEISSKRSDHVYKKQKRDERINYISEPYYNTYNEKKPQNKNQKRQRNIEENNKKSKESPENSRGGKHRKKRQINVQIDKLEEPSNNFRKRKKNLSKNDEYIYYCEIPSEEDSFMNNVSFSNKNIDTNFMNTINNIPKQKKNDDKIDPKILKQFKILSELENSKIIKKLEKEKQKLNEENKKLNKDYSNFEKERQKFEQEKKLFFESRDRVINDSRKNEERLIQLENELQNKFLEKKNEIQQMREQLKQEQFNLDNERNKMRDNYQIRLSKLEEDYKIKEETQNYNNNLNIDKTRKEQELLRQKEKEINELQKAFQEKEDNLNQRENELINKENELQEKEADLNEKYQNLLEKEKNLMGEKQQFMNNNEENQKDLYLKSQQLNNKEQELINRENMLQDKENEIKNRENKIYDVENNLKNREDLLNETQNKIFNQQNQINDREKKLDLLNKEIKDKRNQIIELNHTYNDMMSKLNSPQKENNNLESSKGSKEINVDINNFDIMNRPSITAVRKLDKKFNPNNSANAENQPINKVVTFGQNQSSLASNYSNNKRDIRDNDSYPENNLKDIKDNDAFPENHLHDIQDNDEYPENHGEDDFIYGNKDNANNNMNNEEYEEIAEDFDQYINNQSQNDKSQNMNTNKNNMNLPMDEPEENKKDENQNDDNTEPFNFYQENNNDLMQSKNNESKNDIKDNILPDNNDMINGNENLNNDMNKLNESESGEIDLNNLHNEDLDIEGSQNKNDLNNQNANKISNEHENEINDIVEELLVEEYNPSLGLMKMENPSYLNSFIQCFAHIPDITNKVINLHLDENFSKTLPNLKLTKNYRNLLINCFFPEKLFNMEKQAYNPTKFRNAINELNPLFQNNNEIELKEYINFFILKLHDELNTKKDALSQNNEMNNNEPEIKNENEELISFLKSFTEKNNSIISKTLYGITKYTLYCNQCQNTFYNFHCYSHLYFNLDNVLDYKINRYHREDLDLNLNDCLDYYQKAETLRGDNGIFCPSCKVQTESTSIKNIYSTKNVIIFILDRNSGDKFNQTFINFDEILNLRDYVEYKKEGEKHREKFFLGGVINYYVGDDEQNGTYNAFVRMGKRSDWYCYEDENVYSVTLDDIKNNGYPVVLFYHKLTKK